MRVLRIPITKQYLLFYVLTIFLFLTSATMYFLPSSDATCSITLKVTDTAGNPLPVVAPGNTIRYSGHISENCPGTLEIQAKKTKGSGPELLHNPLIINSFDSNRGYTIDIGVHPQFPVGSSYIVTAFEANNPSNSYTITGGTSAITVREGTNIICNTPIASNLVNQTDCKANTSCPEKYTVGGQTFCTTKAAVDRHKACLEANSANRIFSKTNVKEACFKGTNLSPASNCDDKSTLPFWQPGWEIGYMCPSTTPYACVSNNTIYCSPTKISSVKLKIEPNPVKTRGPATFTANNCLAGGTAVFHWKNAKTGNTDSGKATVDNEGNATYIHTKGFPSPVTYDDVYVECSGKQSEKTSFTVKDVSECSFVDTLSTDTPKPYTTATSFTITGKIANCQNKDRSVGPTGLKLFFALDGGTESFSASIATDSQGAFTQKNIVFTQTGTWKVALYNEQKPLNGSTLSITIDGEEQLSCGGDANPNDTRCPKECPSVDLSRIRGGAEHWVCANEEELLAESGCIKTESILEDIDKKCDDSKELKDPVACGEGVGLSCGGLGNMCLKGDEKNEENVMCQTEGKAPTPIPPSPPCAIRASNSGMCTAVNSSVGILNTEPTYFVKSVFRILLSLSGGIALLLLIRSGYQIMTSKGDPEQLKEARERFTSTVVGLLFLIFSLVILQVIGVDILHIPGLSS